jgi:uncharacterized protein GlcG (DUF336 family)
MSRVGLMNRALIERLEERCLFSAVELTAAEVSQIVSQAAAVSLPSQTIVVVDRSGDILAIYGQAPSVASQTASPTDLAQMEAINGAGKLGGALGENIASKYALLEATKEARVTAAFESTQDAFTSRTARFIVQNDYPPGVSNTESGPLLGVEFSTAEGTDVIPPGLSTGLANGYSGNPGGIPLYIDGQPVGAIGVAGSGSIIAARSDLVAEYNPAYPADQQLPAYLSDPTGAFYNGTEEYSFDEAVALAGAQGYMAPQAIQATNIFLNGISLPFTAESAASGPPPANIPGLTNNGKPLSALPPRTFFAYAPLDKATAAIIGGSPSPYVSGQIPLTNGTLITGLFDNNNPQAGGLGYISGETRVSNGGFIPDVQPDGSILWLASDFGFIGGASVDGTGVHLSKKNLLEIVSQGVTEAQSIRGAIREPADVPAQVFVTVTDAQGNLLAVFQNTDATTFSFDVAVQKARTAAFFSSDNYAFSSRAIGFMADATFPPSIENGVVGPLYQLQNYLSLPQNQAMFLPNITEDINGVATVVPNPLGNGINIFPGGAPLYKNGHLVGGVGVSGDGVDQDDLIAYAGSANFRAPSNIQDDSLSSSQIVSFITQKVEELGYQPPTGDPSFTFPTIGFGTTVVGFDNPDANNFDNIVTSPNDTIIDRILERLQAVGLDGVNLPFQKFPRNPEL